MTTATDTPHPVGSRVLDDVWERAGTVVRLAPDEAPYVLVRWDDGRPSWTLISRDLRGCPDEPTH